MSYFKINLSEISDCKICSLQFLLTSKLCKYFHYLVIYVFHVVKIWYRLLFTEISELKHEEDQLDKMIDVCTDQLKMLTEDANCSKYPFK